MTVMKIFCIFLLWAAVILCLYGINYYTNYIKETKGAFEMRKWDELVDYLQDKNLVGSDIMSKHCAKNELKEDNAKKCNTVLWVLAIIGAVAAVAAIAYAVYRYMTPDYLDDFDDEFDDEFDDDFFDDEEDDEQESEKENEYTTVK